MLTDEELAAARALVDAATPGPWTLQEHTKIDKRFELRPSHVIFDYDDVDHERVDSDASFISAARTLVPTLRYSTRSSDCAPNSNRREQ